MCFVFTCGETSFKKEVEGYEGKVFQCHNCGNFSGRVKKTNPWFTFCFIPVIPLSMKGYTDVLCDICNFAQPVENRPDLLSAKGQPQGYPMQPQQGPPQGWNQGPPQGWTQSPPPQGYGNSPPPGFQGHSPPPNQPMRYG